MLFFRLRLAVGYLALFALAFQAAMAFGHTHTHKHPRTDNLVSRAMTYGACAPTKRPQCPPADHNNNETACAICWSMQVAKSAVLHSPLAIKLPSKIVEPHLPIPSAASIGSNDTVHFYARGPPRVHLS